MGNIAITLPSQAQPESNIKVKFDGTLEIHPENPEKCATDGGQRSFSHQFSVGRSRRLACRKATVSEGKKTRGFRMSVAGCLPSVSLSARLGHALQTSASLLVALNTPRTLEQQCLSLCCRESDPLDRGLQVGFLCGENTVTWNG